MAIRRSLLAYGALVVLALAGEPAFAITLRSLTLSQGQLSPSFQSAQFNYTATVGSTVTQIRVTALAAGIGTSLTVNGINATYGQPSAPVALVEGPNTIRIVARGRTSWWSFVTTHTYTVVVTRPVGNGAPTITSISAEPTSALLGTPVTLTAAAADPEDGDLSAGIVWSSSRDGALGAGASVAPTLTAGVHAITASVTDSGGKSASASVTVTITNPSSGSGRPNILFILADDLGAEASILYPELAGNSGQVATPNLQALAAGGLVFDNVWANPVCSPSRAAIVSGLYGHRTGVTYVGDVLQPATTTSIFEYIAAASPENYAMAVYGKWHLGPTIQHVRDTGVPEFRGFLGGGISNYFNWNVVDIDGTTTNTTTYATTALTNFAIEFIAEHEAGPSAAEPWFVYLPYNAPHGTGASTGFQVPPANLHSVNVGNLQPGAIQDSVPVYKAMIQAMDTEIGRLLAAIGPVGSPERDNTVVIFMGDNGTPMAVKDAGAGVRGSKSTVYEGGVLVPLVVAGPGVTRIGARENALVVATDLYATLASLSGIPVSQVGNSFSLVPLFSDPNAMTGRSFGFTEMCTTQSLYAIHDERYKLMYNNGVWALYDLLTDPLETTNRYSDAGLAGVRAVLEAELLTLEQSAQDGCF
jgi:arylsulfatase A-like enzyme